MTQSNENPKDPADQLVIVGEAKYLELLADYNTLLAKWGNLNEEAKCLANFTELERSAIMAVLAEYISASKANGAFNSAHEGYGVLLEEVDELWDEVKKKGAVRSRSEMCGEAMQVSAMGLRFMVDICLTPERKLTSLHST